MNLIKPEKLKKGDTISIVAPSGCIDMEKIEKSVKYFNSEGYKVKLGANIQKKDRYMAGNDDERISDIHKAFEDKEVKAVICARGGYGAIRLINKIDYKLIKNNPKIFCGYSDISALSAMILKNSGLITFSGPMEKSDFQFDGINDFTIKNFWQTVTSNKIIISTKEKNKFSNNNDAQGIMFGGNLTTIASLCGTDFIPTEKFIFFAEDLNEPVYKIDKYFTQLLNIKDFKKNLSAIALGEFLDIDDKSELEELFKELGRKLNIPIIGTFPFTHGREKATVPFGAKASMSNNTLEIEY